MKIRILDPEEGDQLLELGVDITPGAAADLILDHRDRGVVKWGLWEQADTQLELEMMTRTGILDALQEKAEDVLRLVPIIGGG